jgi:MurNAc alpha-1-phosphate uridylyltransferase
MRAMILAAGRGERMRPLTDHTPKPLLQVGGKPLIVWHIERLVAAEIIDIVINHAWLGEQIEAALGDGHRWGARIRYSAEQPALETAGGIARALPLLGDAPFLVVNGDIWCDWAMDRAHDQAHRMAQHRAAMWLLLVDNPSHHRHGDFVLRPDGILALTGEPRLTFAGIALYAPGFFSKVTPGEPVALAPLLRDRIANEVALGEHHQGKWVDVGTPARLDELNISQYQGTKPGFSNATEY